MAILEYRVPATVTDGKTPGVASSMLTVLATGLNQAITELAITAAGPRGRVNQPPATCPGGPIFGIQAARPESSSQRTLGQISVLPDPSVVAGGAHRARNLGRGRSSIDRGTLAAGRP